MFGPLGCYATAGAYTDVDYDYADAESVPPRIEAYPSYAYEGRTVYLVDGRWYYRRGPRWVYYRREPAELYRRRVYVARSPRGPERRAEERREHDLRREEQQREQDLRREERRRDVDRHREEQEREVDRRREQRFDGHRRD
jgi:hypothetical protein